MVKGKPNETYNIGNNNNPISVKDLANKIIKISGKNFFNIKNILLLTKVIGKKKRNL